MKSVHFRQRPSVLLEGCLLNNCHSSFAGKICAQLGFRKLPAIFLIFSFDAILAMGNSDKNNYLNMSQFQATLISQHPKCGDCKTEIDTQQQKFRYSLEQFCGHFFRQNCLTINFRDAFSLTDLSNEYFPGSQEKYYFFQLQFKKSNIYESLDLYLYCGFFSYS